MTSEEAYMVIVWAIKALGIMLLVIGIVVIIALAHAPDFPNDDGERM